MPRSLLSAMWLPLIYCLAFGGTFPFGGVAWAADRPNILFAISDDQSYPYASAYGTTGVKTPAFDRVAREGLLFENAFCASPGCSPCRAAILTGRHTWMIEQAGTHASSFPKRYTVFPDLLEQAGYAIGYTGKGWGPGNFRTSGRTRNPAGPAFQKRKMKSPPGISSNDYAANFEDFLQAKPKDAPFYFWYGASEPHRVYAKRSYPEEERKTAFVPSFLPDAPTVREDILDYCFEIEWFDRHLGRMLDLLEERGELDNTLVIVTSDNGMPFPRAKANCYEYGIHAPLAVRWPGGIDNPGRSVKQVVGFVDFAPTMLKAANVTVPQEYIGRALQDVMGTPAKLSTPRVAYSARERHSSSRWNNLTYPQRALRTSDYLYIRNFRPERWPAGHPQGFNGAPYGYYDIDDGRTKRELLTGSDRNLERFLELAVGKRPAEELFDIRTDPGNLTNLATSPNHQAILKQLREQLENTLRETGDPRIVDGGDIYEEYRRYSPIRSFPPPETAAE